MENQKQLIFEFEDDALANALKADNLLAFRRSDRRLECTQ